MSERLVIGSGGREHAIGWRLAQSGRVYTAPGNGGTERIGENVQIDVTDIEGLLRFAKDNKIGLTVVGPEHPLQLGIVDKFTEEGLPIFGPTQKAAQLETSKAFAVSFMGRHGIPHPDSVIFDSPEEARMFAEHPKWNKFVVKASGLAGGKGVFLPDNLEEAYDAIDRILVKQEFDKKDKKDRVVIQERLEGEEISLIAISDGKTVVPFLPSQDHKRAFDGDKGPNTGGMGAYAPATIMTEALIQEAYRTILKPTIDGMAEEGNPFKGVLYAGLMITKDGPKVLEYNVRFGDPETQPLMVLLQSDLARIAEASINGTLTKGHIKFRRGFATSVVFASAGYPGSVENGKVINGINDIYGPVEVFHAGTKIKDGQLVTNGGRVLAVNGYSSITLKQATREAYSAARRIGFEGAWYRKDIASRGIK